MGDFFLWTRCPVCHCNCEYVILKVVFRIGSMHDSCEIALWRMPQDATDYLIWWLCDVKQQVMTHYDDVIMMAIASQITSLTSVYSAVYSGAHQRKHQSSASLAFVQGIHRGPVNSPHKWPVTRKMFPFDDVIMIYRSWPGPWRLILTNTRRKRKGQLYPCCITPHPTL